MYGGKQLRSSPHDGLSLGRTAPRLCCQYDLPHGQPAEMGWCISGSKIADLGLSIMEAAVASHHFNQLSMRQEAYGQRKQGNVRPEDRAPHGDPCCCLRTMPLAASEVHQKSAERNCQRSDLNHIDSTNQWGSCIRWPYSREYPGPETVPQHWQFWGSVNQHWTSGISNRFLNSASARPGEVVACNWLAEICQTATEIDSWKQKNCQNTIELIGISASQTILKTSGVSNRFLNGASARPGEVVACNWLAKICQTATEIDSWKQKNCQNTIELIGISASQTILKTSGVSNRFLNVANARPGEVVADWHSEICQTATESIHENKKIAKILPKYANKLSHVGRKTLVRIATGIDLFYTIKHLKNKTLFFFLGHTEVQPETN